MQLTIDGETFRVEVEGADDRPALMLSPSLGTDLSLFDAQMPALLAHFRVVRYDPRGHGGSTVAGAPYALARLGHDALAILDALGIETTYFLGMSMGGAVGQWLLVNAPHRIVRAVLANTSARFGTPEIWNARIAGVLAHGTQALAAATMERWFSAAFRESAPDRVAAIDAVFRKTAAEGYAGACAALRDMDLRAALHAIDRPVLIITGREDPVTSEADIAAMTSAIRGTRHVALDCRHISNIEEEAAFNAAVVGFLTAPMPARAARKPPTRRRTGASRATAARSPLKPAAADARSTGQRGMPRAAPAETSLRTVPAATPVAKAGKAGATKKAAGKKTTATRQTAAARTTPRKAAAKATAKKAAVKKASAKKATVKKASATKTTARKAVATKSTSKKISAKKAATRRPATSRRITSKRTTSKRPSGRRPQR